MKKNVNKKVKFLSVILALSLLLPFDLKTGGDNDFSLAKYEKRIPERYIDFVITSYLGLENQLMYELVQTLKGEERHNNEDVLAKMGKNLECETPDGNTVVSILWAGIIQVLIKDLDTCQNFSVCGDGGQNWGVNSVAITSDGNTIVSTSWNGAEVCVWRKNLATDRYEFAQSLNRSGGNCSVSVVPDGSTIFHKSEDGIVNVWWRPKLQNLTVMQTCFIQGCLKAPNGRLDLRNVSRAEREKYLGVLNSFDLKTKEYLKRNYVTMPRNWDCVIL